MMDAFGVAVPLLGLVVAFIALAASTTWMVGYLSNHDLRIFGAYRIGVAGAVVGLIAVGALS